MIFQDSFTVEPWSLRETHLDLSLLAQTESVFALDETTARRRPASRAART